MAHPYASKAKTGQELANSRYTFPANNSAPESELEEAAEVDHRGEQAEDNFIASPARQVSETGKVKK